MSLYKQIRNLWKNPKSTIKDLQRERLIQWRKDPVVVKLEHPTRLDRARALGYKAKQGFVLTRIRIGRGGRMRPLIRKGRRSKHRRRKKIVSKNYQQIAEERVAKKYTNLQVLNSYLVGKDGVNYFYEVILVDPFHKVIESDKNINWICSNKHKGRVFRGKTSAGRKGRGLRGNKGKGAEKLRPSLRAHGRKGTC